MFRAFRIPTFLIFILSNSVSVPAPANDDCRFLHAKIGETLLGITEGSPTRKNIRALILNQEKAEVLRPTLKTLKAISTSPLLNSFYISAKSHGITRLDPHHVEVTARGIEDPHIYSHEMRFTELMDMDRNHTLYAVLESDVGLPYLFALDLSPARPIGFAPKYGLPIETAPGFFPTEIAVSEKFDGILLSGPLPNLEKPSKQTYGQYWIRGKYDPDLGGVELVTGDILTFGVTKPVKAYYSTHNGLYALHVDGSVSYAMNITALDEMLALDLTPIEGLPKFKRLFSNQNSRAASHIELEIFRSITN